MCDAYFLQTSQHFDPARCQIAERMRVSEMLLNVNVKPLAFDPFHLKDWIFLSSYLDPGGKEVKAHETRETHLDEIVVYRRVSLLLIWDVAQEAANCPIRYSTSNLVNGRKRAAPWARESQPV